MSGNDQPPPTPPQPGPPPGNDPSSGQPSGPAPGDPAPPSGQPPQGGPGGPPPGAPPTAQSGEVPPSGSGRNKALIIGAVLAVLLVIGGGIVAAVLLSGDDDKDSEETSVSEFCDEMTAAFEAEGGAQQEPAKVADRLRDAGVPDELPADAERGLEKLIEIGDDAEDSAEAEQMLDDLEGEDVDNIEALGKFISEDCAEAEESDGTDAP